VSETWHGLCLEYFCIRYALSIFHKLRLKSHSQLEFLCFIILLYYTFYLILVNSTLSKSLICIRRFPFFFLITNYCTNIKQPFVQLVSSFKINSDLYQTCLIFIKVFCSQKCMCHIVV